MQRQRLDVECGGPSWLAMAEGKAAQPVGLAADPHVAHHCRSDRERDRRNRQRRVGHVFHQKPSRPRLAHHARELRDLVGRRLVAIRLDDVAQPGKRLTRRPANHSIEAAGRNVEPVDITAPQRIGAANDAEAGLLECHVEQPDAWKQRKNELLAHSSAPSLAGASGADTPERRLVGLIGSRPYSLPQPSQPGRTGRSNSEQRRRASGTMCSAWA